MSTESRPQLSVVVYARELPAELTRCVASLTRQAGNNHFEIIVVVAGQGQPGIADTQIKLTRCKYGAHAGELRNAGVESSHGSYIAFLPSYLSVPEDWVSTLIAEHAQHSARVIVGAIRNGEPDSRVATAAFICERNRWLSHIDGPVENAPAVNISYHRSLFDSGERYPDLSTESDIHFHKRIKSVQKAELCSVPALRAFYHGERRLRGFLHYNFMEGKRFSQWRRQRGMLDWRKRLALLTLWWLIPLRLLQLTLATTRYEQQLTRLVIRNLPLVLLGWTARAWGELLAGLSTATLAKNAGKNSK